MSHAHDHDPTVGRGVLMAAGGLLIGVMTLTAMVTAGWLPRMADPVATRAAEHVGVAQQRALVFADRSDGAVLVSDAATGAPVTVVAPGEGGFVRATLRRLARARIERGVGAAPPFVLTRWDNGALSLRDPETGESAEIYGFGADHVAAFAAMLGEGGQ